MAATIVDIPFEQVPSARIDAGVRVGRGCPLALIAGPCVIESADHCLRLAEQIGEVCRRLDVRWIFKASYEKANRSSLSGFRGPGLEQGLRVLERVRSEAGVCVLSDVHEVSQAAPAGEVLDVIQIPAFLCRQTELILAAGRTGRAVNLKKGQFMSPDGMANAAEKVLATGNQRVMVTERGTFFGYDRLVNDMTSIARMGGFAPVVFDATHSCQRPGAMGLQSGGEREFVPLLARAAVAAGADALFLEVHDDPPNAKCDAATVWPMDQLAGLLESCLQIAAIVRRREPS